MLGGGGGGVASQQVRTGQWVEAGEPPLQILTQHPQIVREGHMWAPHGQMVGSGAKGAAGHVLLAVRKGDGPLPQTHLSGRET